MEPVSYTFASVNRWNNETQNCDILGLVRLGTPVCRMKLDRQIVAESRKKIAYSTFLNSEDIGLKFTNVLHDVAESSSMIPLGDAKRMSV